MSQSNQNNMLDNAFQFQLAGIEKVEQQWDKYNVYENRKIQRQRTRYYPEVGIRLQQQSLLHSILTTDTPHSTMAHAATNDHSRTTDQHRVDVHTRAQLDTGDGESADEPIGEAQSDGENGDFLLPARLGTARNSMSFNDRLARLNARL
jgi:hypothetical protein